MKTIVFDIDNTLADQTIREAKSTIYGWHRIKEDGMSCSSTIKNGQLKNGIRAEYKSKLDWDKFEDKKLVAGDKPIPQTIELYKLLQSTKKYKMIIVSARKEKLRKVTEKWLKKNGIVYDALYLRETDNIPDVKCKKDIYDKYLIDEDIFFVVDDRIRVCKLWQSLGFFVFNANNLEDW